MLAVAVLKLLLPHLFFSRKSVLEGLIPSIHWGKGVKRQIHILNRFTLFHPIIAKPSAKEVQRVKTYSEIY